jgi:putative protease
MKTKPELLAPAGSWEAFAAAVQNGADAIYMGGTKFNARRFADNFDDEALRKAVEYAHLYGVRVYITVNILIKEKELDELKSFLPLLEECAVDGVIVQDLGAARYIGQNHPNLELHASTQMTIHQLEAVKMLEEMGFSRVVPARELTLEELKYISENSPLELETFIHGALCVSYSGQCLMSSMLGGRSGNRGMCAQPCRLAYTLDKAKNKDAVPVHHISMKDLSTLDFLDEILDAGVTSLKIEGRMKRAEYVAVVTREYRKALDSIRDTGHYKPTKEAEQALQQIFNRGSFTKGYYHGTDHSDLYAREKPNHWGIYLGKVKRLEKNIVWIALEEDIEVGDGIEFWMKGSGNKGQQVSSLFLKGKKAQQGRKGQLAGISSSLRPEPGTPVYRTSAEKQLKEAESSFSNIYNKKLPIAAEATLRIGKNPVLTLQDEDGTQGKAVVNYEIQSAMKKALSEEDIRQQLNKLGDTPFDITSIKLICDDNIFIPVSVLNQLRREAAEDLIKNRIAYYDKRAVSRRTTHKNRVGDSTACRSQMHTATGKANTSPQAGQAVLSVYQAEMKPILNGYVDKLDSPESFHGLDVVSFAPRSFSFKLDVLKEQLESIQQSGIKARLVLPSITRLYDMDFLRKLPDEIWTIFDEYQVGNLGQIPFLKEKGVSHSFGDFTLNVMNSLSIAQLYDLGVMGVVLSPELTTAEIRDIIKRSFLPCEILVYGRIPLMTLEYCAHAVNKGSCSNCRFMGEHTLTDRKGYNFPVRKRWISRCYTEILNSQPIFLADDMNAIHKLPVAAWGLKMEGLSPDERKPIISSYRYALEYPGSSLPEALARYAEAVKKAGFTKGHFFRGVE